MIKVIKNIVFENFIVKYLKKIKLPGLEGLSLYDLLELYLRGIVKGALTERAGAIAYSFFLALFPFLLFILIIIPYLPIPDFKVDFLHFLESFLPPSTSDFFFENIFENINSSQSGLVSSVFVLSVILMANGVNAVFSGFQNSYHEQLSRNVIRQYLYALGIALILAFLLIVTIAFLGYFQIYIVNGFLKVIKTTTGYETSSQYELWAEVAQYLFFIFMVYLATAILYYFGTKEGKASRFFSIGALFTTLLIILTSFLFGIYIENFSQYNKLYGSIGALLILMIYLWMNANILLLGNELNVSIQSLKKNSKKELEEAP